MAPPLATPTPVLCCSPSSAYHHIEHAQPITKTRNAWLILPRRRAIYHPPCRNWSLSCRHQSKGTASESWLGLYLAFCFRLAGGILEQPRGSLLFNAARLPHPGRRTPTLFSIYVEQSWWGYPIRKSTWLCFSKRKTPLPPLPFALHEPGHDRHREQQMSHAARSHTIPSLAAWLLAAAQP